MFFNTSFFAYYRNYSLVATIFLKIVSRRRASRFNDNSCVNKPIYYYSVKPIYCRKKIKMLFTGLGRSVWETTVPLVLRPRAQFFPIRTSRPVNIYIFSLRVGNRLRLRWPNTVFARAFADAIAHVSRDFKKAKHAVNRAIILFTQHPHSLFFYP